MTQDKSNRSQYHNYFVSPHNNGRKQGWRVQHDNADKAVKIYHLKKDAELYASKLASRKSWYVTSQNSDGTIAKKYKPKEMDW